MSCMTISIQGLLGYVMADGAVIGAFGCIFFCFVLVLCITGVSNFPGAMYHWGFYRVLPALIHFRLLC